MKKSQVNGQTLPHLLCAMMSLLLFLVRINIKLVLFLGGGVGGGLHELAIVQVCKLVYCF